MTAVNRSVRLAPDILCATQTSEFHLTDGRMHASLSSSSSYASAWWTPSVEIDDGNGKGAPAGGRGARDSERPWPDYRGGAKPTRTVAPGGGGAVLSAGLAQEFQNVAGVGEFQPARLGAVSEPAIVAPALVLKLDLDPDLLACCSRSFPFCGFQCLFGRGTIVIV
jgi:hypothetical protein